MKKKTRKLSLAKETLYGLNAGNLRAVAGGISLATCIEETCDTCDTCNYNSCGGTCYSCNASCGGTCPAAGCCTCNCC
jgi:hypothetical protein